MDSAHAKDREGLETRLVKLERYRTSLAATLAQNVGVTSSKERSQQRDLDRVVVRIARIRNALTRRLAVPQ